MTSVLLPPHERARLTVNGAMLIEKITRTPLVDSGN